jgi:serine/threonine-protein kinase
MEVTTADEFFAVVAKSRLLTAAQVARARSAIYPGADARTAAWSLVERELISRWQAGQLLAGRSSFYLGKYRLIALLGQGGMGNVFLGQHVTMNRRVALKIISRQSGKDPRSLDRFLAEARAVASLDHPNIVRAYSVDNEDDRYYLVMEYVEGIDLQRLVEAEGPLDCDRAVDYVRQAADGLEHAHQRNMIHCDVKPSNLLVNAQGVVKILDLGLARFAGDEEPGSADLSEGVLGSVDYLAPEQAMKSPTMDHRADIYSLGCTLYFLLAGHPPFVAGSLSARILKHQTQPPPDVRVDQSGVPAELAAICQKMMAKKPDDRYPSAAEVSRVLGAWRPPIIAHRRAVALPMAKLIDELEEETRPPEILAQPVGGRRYSLGLIVIVLLAVVEVAAFLLVIWGHEKPTNNEESPATVRKTVSVPTAPDTSATPREAPAETPPAASSPAKAADGKSP